VYVSVPVVVFTTATINHKQQQQQQQQQQPQQQTTTVTVTTVVTTKQSTRGIDAPPKAREDKTEPAAAAAASTMSRNAVHHASVVVVPGAYAVVPQQRGDRGEEDIVTRLPSTLTSKTVHNNSNHNSTVDRRIARSEECIVQARLRGHYNNDDDAFDERVLTHDEIVNLLRTTRTYREEDAIAIVAQQQQEEEENVNATDEIVLEGTTPNTISTTTNDNNGVVVIANHNSAAHRHRRCLSEASSSSILTEDGPNSDDDDDDDDDNNTTRIPRAQLVVQLSLNENQSDDGATESDLPLRILGTLYIEEQDTRNNNNLNNDDNDADTIWYKKIRNRAQRNKDICILSIILIVVLCTITVFGMLCGISDFCSKSPPSENQSKDDTRTNNDATNHEYRTDQRAIELRDYINDITLGTSTIEYTNSIDEKRPEQKALQWLIEKDPLQLSPDHDDQRIQQRYALLTFWWSMKEKNQQWFNTSGWLLDPDECTWYGLTCNHNSTVVVLPDTNIATATNNSNTRIDELFHYVVAIDLINNNLQGYIPSDIGLLSHLQRIDLSHNALLGTLPDTIGHWTSIQNVTIGNLYPDVFGLRGSIPPTVGNWRGPMILDLFGNIITGTLPLSMSNWTTVLKLDMNGNDLSGTIPSFIALWLNITDLDLGDNALIGTIPSWIGELRQLLYLNLHYNSFTGVLPTSIEQLSKLQEFDVGQNNLTGTIPEGIVSWTTIVTAAFHDNDFSGTLPAILCNYPNLTSLEVECNSSLQVGCPCCGRCNER
jgi:Leucine rich repeat